MNPQQMKFLFLLKAEHTNMHTELQTLPNTYDRAIEILPSALYNSYFKYTMTVECQNVKQNQKELKGSNNR